MSLLAEQWALRVPLKNVARAGCLRTVRGTEAAVVGDDVWFRGINLDDVLLPTLLAIADGPVFILVDDGRLTPVRHSVPTARLPLVEFASAAILLNPALPPAKLPQKTPQSTQLKLVRCDSERPAELWCGPTAEFRTWAETAPEIRLHACRYAVRSAEVPQTLVRGNPLPPLNGQLFWMAGKVALPLRWHWSPTVDQAAMNEVIFANVEQSQDTTDSTIVIWYPAIEQHSDHIVAIAGTSFIPATRSSARRIPYQ